MIKAGIIDPTKVVRLALQDAASVAGLLVTTEAMIGDRPEKSEPASRPAAAWTGWTTKSVSSFRHLITTAAPGQRGGGGFVSTAGWRS